MASSYLFYPAAGAMALLPMPLKEIVGMTVVGYTGSWAAFLLGAYLVGRSLPGLAPREGVSLEARGSAPKPASCGDGSD